MSFPSLSLHGVLPEPLIGQISAHSQVWNTRLVLAPSRYYHVSAVSGKGKSTLISILYGLRQDYQGTVTFDDRDTRRFSPDDWATARQSIFSIVFQDLRLFLSYTGWENIQIKTDLYGKVDSDRVRAMAEELGVLPLLQKPCGKLSYGERQRIALIRALMPPFGWLLLDEPFSHLDEENTRRAVRLIAAECERRQAGLLLTSLGTDAFFSYHQRISL